jgi:hypothetical protein
VHRLLCIGHQMSYFPQVLFFPLIDRQMTEVPCMSRIGRTCHTSQKCNGRLVLAAHDVSMSRISCTWRTSRSAKYASYWLHLMYLCPVLAAHGVLPEVQSMPRIGCT